MPVAIISNLSLAEHFDLYGSVTRRHIERAIELEALVESLYGVDAHISEAKSAYPDEDFLECHLKKLRELLGKIRGANREALKEIIESLAELQQETHNSTEYGLDELKKAEAAIKEV